MAHFANAQQTQIDSYGGLYFVRMGNGMTGVFMQNLNSSKVDISVYIKTGSAFETDSLHGIASVLQKVLSDKINSKLADKGGVINFQNTSFSAATTSEITVYKLTTSPLYVSQCMALLRDSVFKSKITRAEVTKAVNDA